MESRRSRPVFRRQRYARALSKLARAAVALGAYAGCKAADAPEEVTVRDVLKIEVSASQLPADGASTTQVTARLAAPANGGTVLRSVHFSTTAGVFLTSGTATAVAAVDGDTTASVSLRAPRDRGDAEILATGRQSQARTIVRFIDALPTAMTLEPSDFVAKPTPSSVIGLSAFLRRDVGSVAKGLSITLRDEIPNNATPPGLFSSATVTNENGVITARYTPGCHASPGRRTLIATFSSGSSSVSANTTIEVLPPDSATTAQCSPSSR